MREVVIHFESTATQDNPVNTNTANRDRLDKRGTFAETRQDTDLEQQRAQAGIVRAHNHNSIPPWDGSVKAGKPLETKLRVFEVQVTAYFARRGVMMCLLRASRFDFSLGRNMDCEGSLAMLQSI